MKFMKMSAFKILDSQGRVVLPVEMREYVDIHKGDIIELKIQGNGIVIEKLDVIKLNDESLTNMQNAVISTAKKLDQSSLLFLAKRFVELAERKENSD